MFGDINGDGLTDIIRRNGNISSQKNDSFQFGFSVKFDWFGYSKILQYNKYYDCDDKDNNVTYQCTEDFSCK